MESVVFVQMVTDILYLSRLDMKVDDPKYTKVFTSGNSMSYVVGKDVNNNCLMNAQAFILFCLSTVS